MYGPRVQETSTTTGTGAFTLSGTPATGCRTFTAAFGITTTTQICEYTIDDGAGNWEIGIGHISATNTLQRDLVLYSSNANALVSFAAATTVYNTWMGGGIVDVYTTSGTFTLRPGAVSVTANLIGAGGGSGSGCNAATATARCGGGGGGGGGASSMTWPASVIGSAGATVAVTVSTGGSAGAAKTAAGAGNNGGTPSDTQFGNFLRAGSGALGTGAASGTATTGGAGGAGNIGTGGAGGGCATTGVATAGSNGIGMGAGGGAAGSGIPTGNTTQAGKTGGNGSPYHGSTLTGGAAGTGTTAPTIGTQCTSNESCGGPGGGGGTSAATSATGAALNGAAGGMYGGGAGGGAGLLTAGSNPSGAGAQGGPGIAVIITEF